jgi:hypothetical protein
MVCNKLTNRGGIAFLEEILTEVTWIKRTDGSISDQKVSAASFPEKARRHTERRLESPRALLDPFIQGKIFQSVESQGSSCGRGVRF